MINMNPQNQVNIDQPPIPAVGINGMYSAFNQIYAIENIETKLQDINDDLFIWNIVFPLPQKYSKLSKQKTTQGFDTKIRNTSRNGQFPKSVLQLVENQKMPQEIQNEEINKKLPDYSFLHIIYAEISNLQDFYSRKSYSQELIKDRKIVEQIYTLLKHKHQTIEGLTMLFRVITLIIKNSLLESLELEIYNPPPVDQNSDLGKFKLILNDDEEFTLFLIQIQYLYATSNFDILQPNCILPNKELEDGDQNIIQIFDREQKMFRNMIFKIPDFHYQDFSSFSNPTSYQIGSIEYLISVEYKSWIVRNVASVNSFLDQFYKFLKEDSYKFTSIQEFEDKMPKLSLISGKGIGGGLLTAIEDLNYCSRLKIHFIKDLTEEEMIKSIKITDPNLPFTKLLQDSFTNNVYLHVWKNYYDFKCINKKLGGFGSDPNNSFDKRYKFEPFIFGDPCTEEYRNLNQKIFSLMKKKRLTFLQVLEHELSDTEKKLFDDSWKQREQDLELFFYILVDRLNDNFYVNSKLTLNLFNLEELFPKIIKEDVYHQISTDSLTPGITFNRKWSRDDFIKPLNIVDILKSIDQDDTANHILENCTTYQIPSSLNHKLKDILEINKKKTIATLSSFNMSNKRRKVPPKLQVVGKNKIRIVYQVENNPDQINHNVDRAGLPEFPIGAEGQYERFGAPNDPPQFDLKQDILKFYGNNNIQLTSEIVHVTSQYHIEMVRKGEEILIEQKNYDRPRFGRRLRQHEEQDEDKTLLKYQNIDLNTSYSKVKYSIISNTGVNSFWVPSSNKTQHFLYC